MPEHEELAAQLDGWTPAKILRQTGVGQRWIADGEQCASDLAIAAAQRIFAEGVISPEDVDFLLFVDAGAGLLPAGQCLHRPGQTRPVARDCCPRHQPGLLGVRVCPGGRARLDVAGLGRCGLILTGDTAHRTIGRPSRHRDACSATLQRRQC